MKTSNPESQLQPLKEMLVHGNCPIGAPATLQALPRAQGLLFSAPKTIRPSPALGKA